ncbi:uncharacterized protein LOC130891170 [Diorhabda carinulata]|uniref:uncharacterized protein LOC130444171 n=1 Tax=Diorhabda sublineata TaxID=1163346 RepID=UPI0024E0A96B|nr:uncharacterized protein LOC130444171 [Diorhabda sublineata]XP_057651751.1 uncharacterized protein LOC130891170 [Diorhabda carinulata]
MNNVKTPVSLLNEFADKYRTEKPLYSDAVSEIPSYPFKCTVQVGSIIAHGYALTKKEAKHKCAQEALNKLGVEFKTTISLNNNTETFKSVNYIGLLNEHAAKKQVPYPLYKESICNTQEFVIHCHFMNLKTEGRALNKKVAKQEAARQMLDRVDNENIIYPLKDYSNSQNLIDDDSMKKILQKYSSLQILNEPLKADIQLGLPIVENHVVTMEELIEQLEKKGHTCNIELFQQDPYMVVLKIDGGTLAVMGHGETRKLAMNNLYEKASTMFQNGFTFKSTFKKEL